MKICHLTSVHPYNDIRISIKECASLFNDGYEVHLIAPNTQDKEFKGIKVHGMHNFYKGRTKRARKFTRDVYKKALEIDAEIYHFHDPELIPIGLKLKKQGKKVIYDVHEDVPRQIMSKYWIPKPFRKISSTIFEKYENRSCKRFDTIVTATPHIEKRFKKITDNVVNINNYPILEELFNPDYKKIHKKKNVTYIGGITEGRGSVSMVNAISRTVATLTLAGKFSTEHERTKLEKLNGWQNVNYLGFVDREQIKNVLTKSSAGLVVLEPKVNFIDSLPIKMFEYMSAGIPVIASNFPLWKEIIENNQCGICVDPLDAKEIEAAIQRVIDNPKEASRMGRNGREAIEKYFNWEQESTKLLEVYKQIQT